MSQLRLETADLVDALVDAYEADARTHMDMESQSPHLLADRGSLRVAVDAVRKVIAEHHKAQWSELIDQAPGAPKVFGVDYTLGEPIPVTAESLGLGDVLRDIATAGGPLRFKTPPTVYPGAPAEVLAGLAELDQAVYRLSDEWRTPVRDEGDE